MEEQALLLRSCDADTIAWRRAGGICLARFPADATARKELMIGLLTECTGARWNLAGRLRRGRNQGGLLRLKQGRRGGRKLEREREGCRERSRKPEGQRTRVRRGLKMRAPPARRQPS